MLSIKESYLTNNDKRLAEFRSLPNRFQSVMQIICLIDEPCRQSELLPCLQAALKYQYKKKISSSILADILQSLRKQQFINLDHVSIGGLRYKILDETRAHEWTKYFIGEVQHSFPFFDQLGFRGANRYHINRCQNEIIFCLLLPDFPRVKKVMRIVDKEFPLANQSNQFLLSCCQPFLQSSWFLQIPWSTLGFVVEGMLVQGIDRLIPLNQSLFSKAEQDMRSKKRVSHILSESMLWLWLVRGDIDSVISYIKDFDAMPYVRMIKPWVSFVQGNYQEARDLWLALATPSIKERIDFSKLFNHFSSLFLLLLLGCSREKKDHEVLSELYLRLKDIATPYDQVFQMMAYFFVDAGVLSDRELVHDNDQSRIADKNRLQSLVIAILKFRFNKSFSGEQQEDLKDIFYQSDLNGYQWIAAECSELIGQLNVTNTFRIKTAKELHRKQNTVSMIPRLKGVESWENTLNILAKIALGPAASKEDKVGKQRLAWFLDMSDYSCSFFPREQILKQDGSWTRGRLIGLKRLFSSSELSLLTAFDKEVISTIRRELYGNYGQITYHFADWKSTLLALAGHPYIFLEQSPDLHIELVKGKFELFVNQKENHYHIYFPYDVEKDLIIYKESLTKYRLLQVTKAHRQIADIVSIEGISLPLQAKDALIRTLGTLSSVVLIHSILENNQDELLDTKADERLFIHLIPLGVGFKLELLVKPFEHGGLYFKPGRGGSHVMTSFAGKRYQCQRDLMQEKQKVEALLIACPALAELKQSQLEWVIPVPETCLVILQQLQDVKDICIEWPKGEKIKIVKNASFSHINLSIKKKNNWFYVDGSLSLDESKVIQFQELLAGIKEANSQFIPLGKGKFLALTDALRKKVEEIGAFTENTKKGLRFHPLASAAVDEVIRHCDFVELDQHWFHTIERIKKAQSVQPILPDELRVELRHYQKEGFDWLSKLFEWEVGGCLADDMGLGKTIQALSLMSAKGGCGPSLVIAPTSVCGNWRQEIEKFVTNLRAVSFDTPNRYEVLENLQPYDVFITSYGLLQKEITALAKIEWCTVVLDEAQAIKNYLTKRSKAAMMLNSRFKMITTGTPIENHLGELWNLFQFINPGLLGSLRQFNHKYGYPIEKLKDDLARNQLKKLIGPFMLRRLKSQVLKELPPRTEVTINVELSEDEWIFYEALRRNLLEDVENNTDGGNQSKSVQILAAITKLRRVCCHPQLIAPDTQLIGSKLTAFSEILYDLLESGHKVLVFSQFVGHLKILENYLKSEKVTYQYLDGSTPIKEREIRIRDFQAGIGDVFLISLKAGGFGINLTSADYVIHMDPWWNPAVEDQASDRAHRIGQTKPVTVYRLVTRNTIEEKIIHLHARKRKLAQDLLEGSDISGKLTAGELLNLLRER